MPNDKSHTIKDWKSRGLIYDDYNELYEVYIKTMNCQHCNKEFKNTKDRCMDHDHSNGLFRKIVCRACNTSDSYIKYPNGYPVDYIKNYKKEWFQKNKKPIDCICGSILNGKSSLTRHLKTERHLNNMDLYMENVD